jgi:hypothetical protein
MLHTTSSRFVVALLLLLAGYVAGRASAPASVHAQQSGRVFELRTYTAAEGKLDALNSRFRDHTVRMFQKHGITSIGYWTPMDPPQSQNTVTYILAYPSRETAKTSWAAFQNDPEWQKARNASEAQGKLVTKVESVFLTPTDYSPMK